MKVLIAVDSSETSHVAEAATARPWPSGSKFCVMSVVNLPQWEGMPALIEDAKKAAQSAVKRATDKLREAGLSVSSEIPFGYPKETITRYAKNWGADLIMVGSHGNGVLTRFFLGSVAQAVLRTAPCSVEIVRTSPGSSSTSHGMKILLATDGSECSAKAVCSVATRPWPPKSEVRILSAVELLTVDVPPFFAAVSVPSVVDEVIEIGRTRGAEATANARKALGGSGLALSEAMPLGDPRGIILDEAKAWNADLIVLGSHGRHGLERLVMGSVAETVSVYAHCSVEVVRG